MTPLTTIADATDIYTARKVVDALRRAGWIIVRHDAIKLAQAHARDEASDNIREAA